MGRFMQRDPLEYVDGQSLYAGYFVADGVYSDPMGLNTYRIISQGQYQQGSDIVQEPESDEETAWNPDLTRGASAQTYYGVISSIAASGRELGFDNFADLTQHWLGNTGNRYWLNGGEVFADSPSFRRNVRRERNALMAHVENTSLQPLNAGYWAADDWEAEAIQRSINTGDIDWHLAIRGYSEFSNAHVLCIGRSQNGQRIFRARVNIYVFKHWNFEHNNNFSIPGVGTIRGERADNVHTAGLARNFVAEGTHTHVFTWEEGQRFPLDGGVGVNPE